MTERAFIRTNWFTTVLSWVAAIVVLATTFYFNTNNSVASHEKKLTKHDNDIERIDNEVQTKASIEYVDKMRVEREGQIKSLQDSKADKDLVNAIDKKFDIIIKLISDNNAKLDDHIKNSK
jgi:hypothetical protein